MLNWTWKKIKLRSDGLVLGDYEADTLTRTTTIEVEKGENENDCVCLEDLLTRLEKMLLKKF